MWRPDAMFIIVYVIGIHFKKRIKIPQSCNSIWVPWQPEQITMKKRGLLSEDGSVASYKDSKIAGTGKQRGMLRERAPHSCPLGNHQNRQNGLLTEEPFLWCSTILTTVTEQVSVWSMSSLVSGVTSLSHPPLVTHETDDLTVGSSSISNHPDTASHVLPVWWPHRPRRVPPVPRTPRRTRWMEGCTPSTRRTWGRLSSWWTTSGGAAPTLSPKKQTGKQHMKCSECDALLDWWIYLLQSQIQHLNHQV